MGRHFVKATYALEGDGPLIFSTYRQLQEILNACRLNHWPNVEAVARKLTEENNALNVREFVMLYAASNSVVLA